MNPGFAAIFAPIALLLPAGLLDRAASEGDRTARLTAEETTADEAPEGEIELSTFTASQSFRPRNQQQVRIEQRVIVRIAPRRTAPRQELLAQLPEGEISANFTEKEAGNCIVIDDIAGVQPGPDNRLMLFMKDRHIVTAQLDRSCRSRDFYSGFYVENSKDGKLCVARDALQSRAGANCAISSLSRLVALKN